MELGEFSERRVGKGVKELLRERGFWTASVVVFLGMATGFPFYEIVIPLEKGSFLKFYQTAVESQIMLFLVPIAAVLSPGASYVRESSSGFLKLYISRTSRIGYTWKKTLCIYAGGFFPFFLAGFFGLLLCFFFLYPLELEGKIPWEGIRGAMETLLRVSFVGGILAELSGIFAAAFRNYYMAYGLPFVAYYMMVILKERYLPKLYALYPGEWILCKENWGPDGTGIWVFFLVFSAVSLCIHSLLLYWRVQEI